MEEKENISMKQGEEGYTRSTLAKKMTSMVKPVVANAVRSLFSRESHPHEVLSIADLGCSTGPNTYFSVISTVIESVESKCQELSFQVPELQFYLNDLPSNDFNTLFKGLTGLLQRQEGKNIFVMGAPGSFYGRLFPRKSLHLVHASHSGHYLSQVPSGLKSKEGLPLNKGRIYISKTSPPSVRKAYLDQFQEDFTLFLKSRAMEMVPHGHMILMLLGRESTDPANMESCYMWELLAEAISDMVEQGLIAKEKLDSFDVPFYTASSEEIQGVVDKEGSFSIEHMQLFAINHFADVVEGEDTWVKAERVCKVIRNFTELSHHFGEEILDKLCDKFANILVENIKKELPMNITNILVVLSRKAV